MITTLTNANKVTNSALSIVYSQTEVEDSDGNYFEVTRRASHSYSFIGLDRTAAELIAKLKQAKYARFDTKWMRRTMDVGSFEDVKMWTRTNATSQWFWRAKNAANVSFSPDHNRWRVTIDVNEEDVAYVNKSYGVGYDQLLVRVNDPVKLFNDLPQFSLRSYDDGDDFGSPIELTGNYSLTNSDTTTTIKLYIVGPFESSGVYNPLLSDISLEHAYSTSTGTLSAWSTVSDVSKFPEDGYIQFSHNAISPISVWWFRLCSSYNGQTIYSNPIPVSGYYCPVS